MFFELIMSNVWFHAGQRNEHEANYNTQIHGLGV